MGTGGEWTRGAFAPKKKNLTPPGNFFGVFLAKSSPGLLNKQPPPPRQSPTLEEFVPDVESFLSRTSNGTLEPDSPFARKLLQSSSV